MKEKIELLIQQMVNLELIEKLPAQRVIFIPNKAPCFWKPDLPILLLSVQYKSLLSHFFQIVWHVLVWGDSSTNPFLIIVANIAHLIAEPGFALGVRNVRF